MVELMSDAYKYRELIWALALKDLTVRYKRSVLGFLWALLNPALLMLILTIVFSTISRMPVKSYAVFLMSTLIPWTFFSQALSYTVESVVGNGDLIKKVYVSKMVFPLAAIIANLINFFLSLIPMLILIAALRFPFHLTWWYVPVPLISLVMFTLGCGFLGATANVFYRDVSHILQIVLSAWFYFTPIIYSLDFISPRLQWMFRFNPLVYSMNGFRLAIYYGILPSLQSVVMSLAMGLITLWIGCTVFRRYQNSFVFYV